MPDSRRYLFASLPQDCRCRRRVGWGAFDVAIEPDRPALFPIACVIGIDAWPATQSAEEDALRRIDNDSHMPRPNHQVSGLRTRHSLEVIGSSVEIGRACIAIRKPSPEKYGMHKV